MKSGGFDYVCDGCGARLDDVPSIAEVSAQRVEQFCLECAAQKYPAREFGCVLCGLDFAKNPSAPWSLCGGNYFCQCICSNPAEHDQDCAEEICVDRHFDAIDASEEGAGIL